MQGFAAAFPIPPIDRKIRGGETEIKGQHQHHGWNRSLLLPRRQQWAQQSSWRRQDRAPPPTKPAGGGGAHFPNLPPPPQQSSRRTASIRQQLPRAPATTTAIGITGSWQPLLSSRLGRLRLIFVTISGNIASNDAIQNACSSPPSTRKHKTRLGEQAVLPLGLTPPQLSALRQIT